MNLHGRCLVLAVALSSSAGLAASKPPGDWLKRVPQKERVRQNPLAQGDSAAAAGAQIFATHCASCHGTNAEGSGKHPSLRSTRVHDATDGELQWLLRNGSLGKGMPSWSGLPEVQRWQVIRYLRSLSTEPLG